MYKKILIILIIILISVGIGYSLAGSKLDNYVKYKLNYQDNELGLYYQQILAIHKRQDQQTPKDSVIMMGDSITQGLVYPKFINFGIGSDTTYGVLNRLNEYQSLKNAKKIILMIGVNDLKRRTNDEIIANYQQLINQLPHEKLIVFAILPVAKSVEKKNPEISNQRIEQLNNSIEKLCFDKGITFINMNEDFINSNGELKDFYHVGDGLHLSKDGYAVWKMYLDKI